MRFFAIQLLLLFGLFAQRANAQPSEVLIQQVGMGNVAAIAQIGSYASLAQTGSENEVRIEQAGGSSVSIVQNGSGNVLAGFDPSGLRDLFATAFQFDSSQLMLSQSGTDNRVFLHQEAGSHAQITQTGTGNTVTLIQGTGAL